MKTGIDKKKKIVIHYISLKPLPQPVACGLPWGVAWDRDKRKIICKNCKRTAEFQTNGRVIRNRYIKEKLLSQQSNDQSNNSS